MKYVINAHGVVSDSLEGPLAPYISGFSNSVSRQGYSFKVVGDKTRLGASFSRWLGQKGVQLNDVLRRSPKCALTCSSKAVPSGYRISRSSRIKTEDRAALEGERCQPC
jgi:hypothetical protein